MLPEAGDFVLDSGFSDFGTREISRWLYAAHRTVDWIEAGGARHHLITEPPRMEHDICVSGQIENLGSMFLEARPRLFRAERSPGGRRAAPTCEDDERWRSQQSADRRNIVMSEPRHTAKELVKVRKAYRLIEETATDALEDGRWDLHDDLREITHHLERLGDMPDV